MTRGTGRYDNIISLGSNCAPAKAIREHFGVERAFPFDWWISSLDSLLAAARADFGDLFVAEDLYVQGEGEAASIASWRFGIAYHHDFDKTGDAFVMADVLAQLPRVQAKYAALFERMRRLVEGSRTLFIRYGIDGLGATERDRIPKVEALHARLCELWPGARIDLLAVSAGELASDFPGGTRPGVAFDQLGPPTGEMWRETQFQALFRRRDLSLVGGRPPVGMAGCDALRRIRVIGFGVTEDRHGYAGPLRAWAARAGIDLRLFGFGGFQIGHLPHLIDIVSDHTDLAGCLLVLELSTSVERPQFTERTRPNYEAFLAEILERARALGAVPLLLHLHRTDVDDQADPLLDFLEAFAARHGVLSLNLGRLVARCVAAGVRPASFLRDACQTTAAGAEFYAAELAAFVEGLTTADLQPPRGPARERLWLTLRSTVGEGGGRRMLDTPHGLPIGFAELAPADGLTVRFDPAVHIGDLLFLSGPEAGYARVDVDGRTVLPRFACFDAWAHYDHLRVERIELPGVSELRLTALGDRPEPDLAEGTWSDRRRVRLSHLLLRPAIPTAWD